MDSMVVEATELDSGCMDSLIAQVTEHDAWWIRDFHRPALDDDGDDDDDNDDDYGVCHRCQHQELQELLRKKHLFGVSRWCHLFIILLLAL